MHPIIEAINSNRAIIAEGEEILSNLKAIAIKIERVMGSISIGGPTESETVKILLKEAGIANFKIMTPYQANKDKNTINRPVLIGGEVVRVSVNLTTGELLFDGQEPDKESHNVYE